MYPRVKEMIRLGRGKPPTGTSTYTESAPYVVGEKPDRRAFRQFVEEVRRCAERPLEPVGRRTLALIDRALKKLQQETEVKVRYVDPRKVPLRIRMRARQLLRERWDREAAERDAKRKSDLERAAEHALTGRWYVRGAEVGQVVPQARMVDGTPIRLHVPNPQHVESTLWRLLGGPAENADHLIVRPT